MATTRGKCFLVTGPPGVGKTTLVMKVVEVLRRSHPHLNIRGFYTREIREGHERVGFEVVTLDGRRGRLASTTVSSAESRRWPSVGKYKVDVTSFESLALPELQVKEDTDLFIIDEVGKMELYSSSFFPAVTGVLESNIPILASIPIPKYGREIPEVWWHPRKYGEKLHGAWTIIYDFNSVLLRKIMELTELLCFSLHG